MTKLSNKQQEIWNVVKAFYLKNDRFPENVEIAKELKLVEEYKGRAGTLHAVINQRLYGLVKKGYLKKGSRLEINKDLLK